MESVSDRLIDVQVATKVENVQLKKSTTPTLIFVTLNEVVEELFDEHQRGSGTVTQLGSDFIPVFARGFEETHISTLLGDQGVPFSGYIAQEVSVTIRNALAYDPSLQEPVVAHVTVNFMRERRILLPPPVPTPSRGASSQLFERLRLLSTNTTETEDHCCICFELLSNKNVIVLPQCLHMFHEHCLFQWLTRLNNCPLCRSVIN